MNSCIISGCSIYLLHRWQLCFFCLMSSMLSYLLSHHNKEVSLLIYQKLVLKRCLSLEVISQQCQSEDQSEVSYRGLYPIQEWNLLRAHLQLIITQWMAILTKKKTWFVGVNHKNYSHELTNIVCNWIWGFQRKLRGIINKC